ncbi:MAG: hypothetical protein AB4080_04020 [Trichodesmium sp.]
MDGEIFPFIADREIDEIFLLLLKFPEVDGEIFPFIADREMVVLFAEALGGGW